MRPTYALLCTSLLFAGCVRSSPAAGAFRPVAPPGYMLVPIDPADAGAPGAHATSYAEAEVLVEDDSDDIFALAARMIEATPKPVGSADLLAYTATMPRAPAPVASAPSGSPATQPLAPSPAHLDATSDNPFADGATYGGAAYGGATYGGASTPSAVNGDNPLAGLDSIGWAPPGGWANYQEIKPQPAKAPRPVDPSLPGRYSVAKEFIRQHRGSHDFDVVGLRFAGAPGGYASMIGATSDGGMLIGAARNTPTAKNEYLNVPELIRVDATGRTMWTANLGAPKFVTFEVPRLVVLPDGGAVVHVQAYRHPARNGNHQLIRVGPDGRVQWRLQLPGTGDTDSPLIQQLRLTAEGSIEIIGSYVRAAELTDRGDWRGHTRRWSGRVSLEGQLFYSQIGEVLGDEERLFPWPRQDQFWDDVSDPTYER